jgi:hypothetical protein
VVTVYEYEIEEVVETVPVEIEQIKYDFIWVEQDLDTYQEPREFEKIPNKVETRETIKQERPVLESSVVVDQV